MNCSQAPSFVPWLYGIIATAVEWLAGHALERIGHGKWWDYSNKKWNMDGYICLQYSVLWGILGLLAMKIGNRLCFTVLHSIPAGFLHITSWILFGILIVDAVGSYAVLHHITKKMPRISAHERSDRRLHQTPFCPCLPLSGASCGTCLSGRTASFGEKEKTETGVFAEGCSFYKIVLLFIIGAFLGDITETIFCRITAGVWMSRSSLVWGPFSIVWGLAIALATWFLYNYRDRSDGFLFAFGTFLGGAYEYICSVFTEIVFGKVFWDYSDIPFNLGRPYQPPVLFLLGNSRRRLAQKILSCHFALD